MMDANNEVVRLVTYLIEFLEYKNVKRKTLRAALIGTTALTALAAMTPASADDRFGGIPTWWFNAISPSGEWAAGGTTSSLLGTSPAPAIFNLSGAENSYPAINGQAYGVDNSGGMVGSYFPASQLQTAFYLDSHGTIHSLDMTPDGDKATAYAVNGSGTIAVGSITHVGILNGTDTDPATAVSWNLSTFQATALPSLGGAHKEDAAYGISDSGTIVGQSDNHAVSWKGSTVNDLGTLPHGDTSAANAISGDGTTAVGFSTGADSIFHAASWKLAPNGTVISVNDLGALAANDISYAQAVNSDGSVIVGWSGINIVSPTNLVGSTAFRWTATDQMQSVLGLLTSEGVVMNGWTLAAATGVSADGTIIVGYGQEGNGVEGWIARIPVPIAPPISGSIHGIDPLPNLPIVNVTGVSGDGSKVVGFSETTDFLTAHSFLWNGTSTDIGASGAGPRNFAYAISGDGNVIVGEENNSVVAYRYANGTMTPLGTLTNGFTSQAFGVNTDGSVIVGQADGASGLHAFRWVLGGPGAATNGGGTMTDIGALNTGNTASVALGVSGDGNVVAGWSALDASNGAAHAFRWTDSGGMVDIGSLGGNSFALAISSDSNVIVGAANVGAATHAFRYTTASNMVDLGTLDGKNSIARAVNQDGSVIVGDNGTAQWANGSHLGLSAGDQAWRWTQGTGMQSVQGLLTSAKVDMTGWNLATATGVSADGRVIVGNGTNGGQSEGWIARIALPGDTAGGGGSGPTGGGGSGPTGGGTTPPPPSGFISFDTLAASLAGQSAIGQIGNGIIGGDLAAFSQYVTQDHGNSGLPWSAFGYVSYNSDPAGSGTVGLTYDLPDAMIVGAAVSADYATTSMVFNGNATMQGGSGGAFVARVPDKGLQWFLSVDGTSLSGSVTRGYLNGSGPASSRGNTGVTGYGATARVGWTFQSPVGDTRLTPFASYTYTDARVGGYTESGGPFPAIMDGFTSRQSTSRVGADARYTFAPGEWVWGSAVWAHTLNGNGAPTISGQLIGLFGVSAPGITGAVDWAEITAGSRLPVWNNGAVTASVTASVPTDDEPVTYVARLGVSQAF
jgi:probable HAF family extracellular repeat protein